MQILSEEEVLLWLVQRSIEVDPYAKNHLPFEGFYRQIGIPGETESAGFFSRNCVCEAEPFHTALLRVTDWSHYTEEEMALFSELRLRQGESRSLVDAPGHLFSADESELLIDLFKLVISMRSGWSAYLYFDGGVTYLTWEGELLDEWRIEEGQRGFNV